MPRPKRAPSDTPPNASILAELPDANALEQRLAGLELEATRVRTLLEAVRSMSGSRQPMQVLDDLATLEESA